MLAVIVLQATPGAWQSWIGRWALAFVIPGIVAVVAGVVGIIYDMTRRPGRWLQRRFRRRPSWEPKRIKAPRGSVPRIASPTSERPMEPAVHRLGTLPSAMPIAPPMPTVELRLRPPVLVDTHVGRVGRSLVLTVTNRGDDSSFSGQLTAVSPEGVYVSGAPLPMPLRWYDTNEETIRIMPGQSRHLLLGRHFQNGMAFLRSGKWDVEPPFILREKPSPMGGGVGEMIGIYPPPTLKTEDINRYRIAMTIRISSEGGYIERSIEIGLDLTPPASAAD